MTTKRKRLYFDIETSPNIGFFWQSGYKLNIGYQNILKERSIICICFKWEGEKEVQALTWDKKQSDKKMLQDFIKVVDTADELVGHNGDKFDLAWIRTRCLYHGIQMFPSYTTIDTLKIARSKFKFNSNRLNYIADFLGIGQKIKTDFDLWKNIALKNDQTALAKMVKYCKMDVILLQKVHEHLSTHILAKTHYGVIFGADRGSCPECGSDEIIIHAKRASASGLKKIVYKCKTCNHFHTKTDK
jgi:DNA polymerase elongation subunit (family B)